MLLGILRGKAVVDCPVYVDKQDLQVLLRAWLVLDPSLFYIVIIQPMASPRPKLLAHTTITRAM
jgi:hypothetical protein